MASAMIEKKSKEEVVDELLLDDALSINGGPPLYTESVLQQLYLACTALQPSTILHHMLLVFRGEPQSDTCVQ
jgi:hypothetical protein